MNSFLGISNFHHGCTFHNHEHKDSRNLNSSVQVKETIGIFAGGEGSMDTSVGARAPQQQAWQWLWSKRPNKDKNHLYSKRILHDNNGTVNSKNVEYFENEKEILWPHLQIQKGFRQGRSGRCCSVKRSLCRLLAEN